MENSGQFGRSGVFLNHLMAMRKECPSEIFLRGSFPGLFLPVLGRAGDASGEGGEKPAWRRVRGSRQLTRVRG